MKKNKKDDIDKMLELDEIHYKEIVKVGEKIKGEKEEKQSKIVCPKCGSSKVRTYIYGLIRGEIPDDCICGGCFVGPDNPIYYCDNCESDIYVNDLKK